MNYTPNEIQNLVFRKSMFGLNQNQVFDMLQRVVEDYSEYIKENVRLKDRLEDVQERVQYYRSIEQSLQNSLVVAQQSGEDIVNNARKQAENIVEEAKLRARAIVEEANKQVLQATFENERLHKDAQAFRARVESLIAAQQKLLSDL